MQRGNLAGMILGVVKMDDVLDQADMLASMSEMPATGSDPMRPADDGAMNPGGADAPMTPERREEIAKRLKSGKKGGFAYEALRRAEQAGGASAINLSGRMKKLGLATDTQIVDRMLDELLAIDAPQETRQRMLDFLAGERVQKSLRDGHLLEAGPESERILRRMAHLILSLPEGQLM
jgi:hypothetical protein